jgi:beta-apo-4'-carotenal oxygenase
VLDNTNGEVLMGGAMDEDDLFIEPPVVQVKTVNDSMVLAGKLWSFYPNPCSRQFGRGYQAS